MPEYPTYLSPAIADSPDPSAAGRGGLALALTFGVILPVACLAFDPIVFRTANDFPGALGGPVLGSYRVFGYSAIGIGIASLSTWLALRRPAGLMAGLLAGGAALALGLGLVLLPFSLLGLFFLIGAFGFIPFGTAVVLAREARAAWRASSGHPRAEWWAAVGVVIACGLPSGLQFGSWAAVRSVMQAMASDDPAEAERGADLLARLWFAADADELVWAWEREQNPDRRRRLADAYRRMTGSDVEHRLMILRD